MPMITDDDRALLSALIDDALPADARAQLEARLTQDADLRAERDALLAVRAILQMLPPLRAPRDLTLTPAQARTPRTAVLLQFLSVASAAAAVVLLAIGITLLTEATTLTPSPDAVIVVMPTEVIAPPVPMNRSDISVEPAQAAPMASPSLAIQPPASQPPLLIQPPLPTQPPPPSVAAVPQVELFSAEEAPIDDDADPSAQRAETGIAAAVEETAADALSFEEASGANASFSAPAAAGATDASTGVAAVAAGVFALVIALGAWLARRRYR